MDGTAYPDDLGTHFPPCFSGGSETSPKVSRVKIRPPHFAGRQFRSMENTVSQKVPRNPDPTVYLDGLGTRFRTGFSRGSEPDPKTSRVKMLKHLQTVISTRIPSFPPPPCQTLANGRPGRDFDGVFTKRSPARISGIFPEIRATGPGKCPNFWKYSRNSGTLDFCQGIHDFAGRAWDF